VPSTLSLYPKQRITAIVIDIYFQYLISLYWTRCILVFFHGVTTHHRLQRQFPLVVWKWHGSENDHRVVDIVIDDFVLHKAFGLFAVSVIHGCRYFSEHFLYGGWEYHHYLCTVLDRVPSLCSWH
jgi:hypothetical protein